MTALAAELAAALREPGPPTRVLDDAALARLAAGFAAAERAARPHLNFAEAAYLGGVLAAAADLAAVRAVRDLVAGGLADPDAVAAGVAAVLCGEPAERFRDAPGGEDQDVGQVSTIRGLGPTSLWRLWSGLDPIPVRSSNVRSIAWEDTRRILFVKYNNNSLYAYAVPGEVFTGMAAAASQGKYVWDKLRGADGRRPARLLDLDSRYPYTRVD